MCVNGGYSALPSLQFRPSKRKTSITVRQKTQFEKYWPSPGYHNTPHTQSIIEWFWPPGWEIAVVAGGVWVTELIYFSLQSCNGGNTGAEERRQLHRAIRHTHLGARTHTHTYTHTHTHTHTDINISKHIHWRNIMNPRPFTQALFLPRAPTRQASHGNWEPS